MVNGLRFTTNPTLCPFTMLISSPWKKSPNIRLRTKNKAWIFVNSFSFIFLDFLVKIYRANFFSWDKKAKKGGTRETGPDWPLRQGGPAGPVRPAQQGSSSGSPRFFPDLLLFDFFGQKIFREV
jgi:hypothetical protein